MDEFMQEALLEARTGAAEGGIPIGAALVEGNRLVAAGGIADCKIRPRLCTPQLSLQCKPQRQEFPRDDLNCLQVV